MPIITSVSGLKLPISALLVPSIAFYIVAEISLFISRMGNDFALLWMPNAITAFLIYRYSIARLVLALIGVALANIAADLPYSQSLAQTLTFVPLNVSETLFISICLKSALSTQCFNHISDYIKTLLITLFVPCSISASFAATLIVGLGDIDAFKSFWQSWFISAVVGLALVYPLGAYLSLAGTGSLATLRRRPSLYELFLIIASVTSIYLFINTFSSPHIFITALFIVIALYKNILVTHYAMFLSAVVFAASMTLGIIKTKIDVSAQEQLVSLAFTLVPPILLAVSFHIKEDMQNRLRELSDHIRDLFESNPIATLSVDSHGYVVAASHSAIEFCGVSQEELIGQHLSHIINEPSEHIVTLLAEKSFNTRVRRRHHQLTPCRFVGAQVRGRATSKRFTFNILDLSNEANLTELLRQEKELLEVTLHSIGDGVVTTDDNGFITFINPVAEQMTGYAFSEAEGMPFEEVFELRDLESGERLASPVRRVLAERRVMGIPETTKLYSRTGDQFDIQDSIAPIFGKNKRLVGSVMVFQDVTTQRQLSQEMSYLAQHDILTNLPNRVLLKDRITHAIENARRERNHLCVLFIDLDNFKTINDSLGHAQGDIVLKHVAERMVTGLRNSDTIARIGGDEFVIISENQYLRADISLLCEKVKTVVSTPVSIDKHDYVMTASIGVAIFPQDGTDSDMLMKHADAAMYRAKQSGRNRYCFYSHAMQEEVSQRLHIDQSIRISLRERSFQVYYQAIYDTRKNDVVAYEALARWPQQDGSFISPDVFISVAEQSDLISQLGEYILHRVCSDIVQNAFMTQGSRRVTVNVSPIQLQVVGSAVKLKAIVDSYSISPDKIIIEITENVLLNETDGSAKELRQLRNMGFLVAIDDFGTGFSSVSYLRKHPVNKLKIDKSFIDEMTADGNEEVFIEAILSMAKALSIEVIAEGIETLAQSKKLTRLGCTQQQGYYHAKPMPIEDIQRKQTNVVPLSYRL